MIRFLKKIASFIGTLIVLLLILTGLYHILSSISIKEGIKPEGVRIGIVPIRGVITTSKDIIKNIERFQRNGSVKAIVLRIDSPGGMVGPTQEIWEKVKEVKRNKKVYASIESIGASGAYYIASAANYIIANPGSLVGSIGVIMEFPNVTELMKKLGFRMNVVKSGRFKDTGSPFREMSDEEKKLLQDVIDDVYQQFLEAVIKERGLKEDRVKEIADGRILTGRMAKAYGLIDDVGGMEKLKNRIKKDLNVQKIHFVYPPKKMVPLLERILWGDEGSRVILQPGIYYIWDAFLKGE